MLEFKCNNIPEVYPQILGTVLKQGRRVEPRGRACLEIAPLCVSALTPRKRMFGTPGRNENPIFPYVEGLWLLSGDDSPTMLSHYVKKTLCYVNPETGRFDGAYGPRVSKTRGLNQLDAVCSRLRKDRDTRRAMVTIFDPALDNNESSLDVPCTISWQFMIREETLEMITYMRSNDLFRGFIYDTIEFQWFQEILAGWLGVDVGTYTHVVGSAHVYLSDRARVNRILSNCARYSSCPSAYESRAPDDARLPKKAFDREIRNLLAIEDLARRGLLRPQIASRKIRERFNCQFYKNLAFAIVGYNIWKQGEERLSATLFELIDNELGPLMMRQTTPRDAVDRVSMNTGELEQEVGKTRLLGSEI